MVFAAFLIYLFGFKRSEGGSLGASIPTIFGPLVTNIFVKNRLPELWVVLDKQGGDRLIQIAFLFAGLIGLVVYLFSGLREVTSDSTEPEFNRRRTSARMPMTLVLVAVIALFSILMVSPDFAPPKESVAKVLGIESPVLTPLTACRIILALLSVTLASLPAPTRKPTTQA